ncbi:MAG: hypothetical protein CSB48_14035 [Proteobacteria bacterium]|nr:MAG: hypothetical protein CSB48_14035 [Pseudomonadota bacterium]
MPGKAGNPGDLKEGHVLASALSKIIFSYQKKYSIIKKDSYASFRVGRWYGCLCFIDNKVFEKQ